MTDGPRRDRRYHDGEPVTAGEVARWVERHERDSTQAHRDLQRMIRVLDERTDKLTVRIAVIFAVATALWSVLLAVAPWVRAILGLPNG